MKTNIIYFVLEAIIISCIGCEPHNQPEETLGFSISPTQKVVFSPGNLQYCAKKDLWQFAKNQYDYIGEENVHISQDYEGWIDLFGWGTGNNPTLNTSDRQEYATFTDWGVNSISGDPQNTWRTLTNDEWDYLVFKRPNACAYYTVAQVNGTNGLILLPDNWTAPKGIVIASGMNTYVPGENYDYGYAAYQTFTASEWKKLEKNGAVFLPAAGWRMQDGYYGTETKILHVQESGLYWNSTKYFIPGYDNWETNESCSLNFGTGAVFVDGGLYRTYGFSVRLVKDL